MALTLEDTMRALSENERAILEHRRARFQQFMEELLPMLKEFMEQLELPDAAMVAVEASRYLPAVDEWAGWQEVEPEIRVWLLAQSVVLLVSCSFRSSAGAGS
jgi:hypothetical protein